MCIYIYLEPYEDPEIDSSEFGPCFGGVKARGYTYGMTRFGMRIRPSSRVSVLQIELGQKKITRTAKPVAMKIVQLRA